MTRQPARMPDLEEAAKRQRGRLPSLLSPTSIVRRFWRSYLRAAQLIVELRAERGSKCLIYFGHIHVSVRPSGQKPAREARSDLAISATIYDPATTVLPSSGPVKRSGPVLRADDAKRPVDKAWRPFMRVLQPAKRGCAGSGDDACPHDSC